MTRTTVVGGRRRCRWLILLVLALVLELQPAAAPAIAGSPGPGGAGRDAAAGSSFVLPVPPPPVVLTPYAPPAQRYGSGHRGVDLAAPAGTTVLAAGSGVVVFAGMLAGRGVISIEHAGGLRTTYEPVIARVATGATVTAGQPIGTLQPGHAGCAPADCLHWGARLPDRVYLDPMSLLGPWRVRLWPWDRH